jgi:chloramphenicol O-acetyltransferase
MNINIPLVTNQQFTQGGQVIQPLAPAIHHNVNGHHVSQITTQMATHIPSYVSQVHTHQHTTNPFLQHPQHTN